MKLSEGLTPVARGSPARTGIEFRLVLRWCAIATTHTAQAMHAKASPTAE